MQPGQPYAALRFERGFTGHEHLSQFGLINMNGRVYDPLVSRFLSPDLFVQAPGNPMSYNRYAYVFNNPLSYTDPSGYISLHHSSDIDNPHAGFNNYDWRWHEMFQPGYGSGAGQWSHQYNSPEFNFGFLSPSAFDRLYGQGAHQGYQNLLNQKRQRDELYKTILAELFAGGGLHYTFVKLFGRTTIISSEGDPGEITWHMGTILFSNPSVKVFLENLVLISSSGEGVMIPNWISTANYVFNLSLQANSLKTQIIDFAVRSNYKSARSWNQFRKLKPRQKAWRQTNTLTKSGAQYLKYAKGLGYVGAGLTTTYSVTSAYNYYNNGGSDWDVYAKSGLDVIMTGVGFLGPIGFGISATYFILDAATGGFGGFGGF